MKESNVFYTWMGLYCVGMAALMWVLGAPGWIGTSLVVMACLCGIEGASRTTISIAYAVFGTAYFGVVVLMGWWGSIEWMPEQIGLLF